MNDLINNVIFLNLFGPGLTVLFASALAVYIWNHDRQETSKKKKDKD